MQRKNMLLLLLAIILTTLILNRPAAAQQITKATISPTTITGDAAAIGQNFTITINIDDVGGDPERGNLWGYQFLLYYNTTVLTATKYVNRANETYSEFNTPSPSEINDDPWGNGTGYVAVAYSCPPANKVGITTTEPKPLADVFFRVDANGTSVLDLIDKRFVMGTTTGYSIRVDWGNLLVSDAYFSNIGTIERHDIAVTSVTPNALKVKPKEILSIDVGISNLGTFDESVVTVTIEYNSTATDFEAIGTPRTALNLAQGGSTTVNFPWNTAGVPEGKYIIRAKATVAQDGDQGNNVKDSDVITVSSGGGGLPINIMYIAGGIIGIVVVVAVVYVLRARKSK